MICEQLTPELAASIVEAISSDERTHIVRRMSPHERHRLLPKVSNEVREEVEQQLQYQARTAGGIMTTEFVSLKPEMTVQQALDHVRTVAAERESIYACYVLGPNSGHLLGAVSLRDLVMADPGRRISEIMRRKPVTVRALDRQWRSEDLNWLGAILLFQGLLGVDFSPRLVRPIVQKSTSQIPAACSTATSDFACSLRAAK